MSERIGERVYAIEWLTRRLGTIVWHPRLEVVRAEHGRDQYAVKWDAGGPVEFRAGFGLHPLKREPVAYADCQRCGAPAHPIRGYCGRFCEEAARYEAERRESETWTLHCHKPGSRAPILNLDPPTPEETRDAFAEAYAALERDVRRAFYLGEPQPVDPLAMWLDDSRTFGGEP